MQQSESVAGKDERESRFDGAEWPAGTAQRPVPQLPARPDRRTLCRTLSVNGFPSTTQLSINFFLLFLSFFLVCRSSFPSETERFKLLFHLFPLPCYIGCARPEPQSFPVCLFFLNTCSDWILPVWGRKASVYSHRKRFWELF